MAGCEKSFPSCSSAAVLALPVPVCFLCGFCLCSRLTLFSVSLLQELIMESQIQSVFTDIGKINFRDPANYYLIPSVPGLASNSVASAAWLSSEGEALFALPSAAGGIFVIKLPPHDLPGKDGGTLHGVPSSSSLGLIFVTCVVWLLCTPIYARAAALLHRACETPPCRQQIFCRQALGVFVFQHCFYFARNGFGGGIETELGGAALPYRLDADCHQVGVWRQTGGASFVFFLIPSRRGRHCFWLKSKAGKSASVNAIGKAKWVTGPVAVPKLGLEGWISSS